MRLYVAITDMEWYQFLSGLMPEEVNFWQPSGGSQFRALTPGEPLLFKLHSPNDYIVGGGFFSHFSILPVSFAWRVFGEKNGAATESEMRRRIEHYRHVSPSSAEDYKIGCILLEQPFFFERSTWIPVPNWAPNIVRGRGYETDQQDGAQLWAHIESRLRGDRLPQPQSTERFGQPQVILPRLGQGAFRVIITDAYERQCALSGSHVLHVLEAAHIRPYARGGEHQPSNGILLRQDIHTLFDKGYITITPEYRVEVSRKIREEFDNGKEYYGLHGNLMHTPARPLVRPSSELLRWHNENLYKG